MSYLKAKMHQIRFLRFPDLISVFKGLTSIRRERRKDRREGQGRGEEWKCKGG